jgi:O-antigen/teichoic acid export membrane protein
MSFALPQLEYPSLSKRCHEFFSLSGARTRTLRSNFLWNAAGSGTFSLCQWGILVVFAKLGSATLVGQLVYGLALTVPLFVAGLQLRPIQATDADKRHTLGQYLGLRALTTVAALVAAVLAAAALWAAGNPAALIILLWTLSKAVDSGSDALYGLFQQSERMDYVGVSLILRGVLAVAGVAVVFRASHSAPLALGGLALGWSAVFIVFDIPMARILLHHRVPSTCAPSAVAETLRPVFDRRQLKPLCFEAAPLGVVAVLLAIQVQVPRYVVEGFLHTRELGLFSAAAYLTFIGSMLVNALGAPACVRLAQFYVAGAYSAFRQLMTKLLLVAVAIGVAGILVSACAGGRILALLYTHEYSRMAGVLTMLCAGSALSYAASFLGYGMTALRRFRIQVPIFVGVVLITVLSCYWLTRRYGVMGTAAGILIGNFGQLLMSAAVVVRTLQEGSAGDGSLHPALEGAGPAVST